MQQNLFRYNKIKIITPIKEFGGSLLQSAARSKRPHIQGQALHIVLRRDDSAKVDFRNHRSELIKLLTGFAARAQVRLYKFAIVSNHIHILLIAGDAQSYNYFVRSVSGRIAQVFKIKWAHRPYTRIVNWGRDYRGTVRYVEQNQLEADGIISYNRRKKVV
jgi:REP element-mobilizing transposase RayT